MLKSIKNLILGAAMAAAMATTVFAGPSGVYENSNGNYIYVSPSNTLYYCDTSNWKQYLTLIDCDECTETYSGHIMDTMFTWNRYQDSILTECSTYYKSDVSVWAPTYGASLDDAAGNYHLYMSGSSNRTNYGDIDTTYVDGEVYSNSEGFLIMMSNGVNYFHFADEAHGYEVGDAVRLY